MHTGTDAAWWSSDLHEADNGVKSAARPEPRRAALLYSPLAARLPRSNALNTGTSGMNSATITRIDVFKSKEHIDYVEALVNLVVRMQVCQKSTNKLDAIFVECLKKMANDDSIKVITSLIQKK